MPSYNLKRFVNPSIFKSVSATTLWGFLLPHKRFLEDKGFSLPDDCGGISDFDYLRLTAILMTPHEDSSPALVDALYFTHEMGTEAAMDDLLDIARGIALPIPDDSTPLEVAMRIWVRDPDALERAHAYRYITKACTFEHYQAESAVAFTAPFEDGLSRMEATLDNWFLEHKCGGSSKVFIYPGNDEVWFLIRHGDSFKRESAVEGYKSKGLFFRPEAFDVACYVHSLGELRIRAKSKGMLDLYRRELSVLIAGDPYYFPGHDKYRLAPILEDGQRALYCKDVPGIDSIMLSGLRVNRRALLARSYHVDYSAPNVFAVFMASDETLNDHDILEKARFTVKFSDSEKPRSVAIYPPNKVQVRRDSDMAPVETWLRKRGFVIGVEAEDEEANGILANM